MIKSDQKKEQISKAGLVYCVLIVSFYCHNFTVQADELNYIYDQKQQLIGVINQQGQTVIYEYDPLGNLLTIQRQDTTGPVEITLVSPNIGPVGTPVEIFGVGFSPITTENQVEFNGVSTPTLSVGSHSITAQVPNGSSSGPISVTTPLGSAESPQPFVVPEMTVSPSDTTAIVRKNLSFTATLTNLDDQRVIWKVNNIVGGDSTIGTITQEGLYTAPLVIPTPSEVMIQATSIPFPSLTGQAVATIVKDPALPDCTIFWDGESGDGLWQTPANWDTNLLPGPTDNACIGAENTVILSIGNHSINSLTSDSALTILGGSSVLTSSAVSHIFNDLTLGGGTFSGTGNVNVSGLLTWKEGSILGTGTTTAYGGMDIRGGGNHFLGEGSQLDLPAGQTANWTNGNLFFAGGTTFNNRGTFRAQHESNKGIHRSGSTGTATFNNEGSFIKEIGTGITSITPAIVFNNTGLGGVQVLTGTLRAQQGGLGQYMTGGADFTVAAGATLNFSVTPTWSNTVDITGMGTVLFSNGTYIINGTYDIKGSTGHTRFLSGSVSFTPSSNLVSISGTGLLEVTNGKVDFSSGETTLENLTTYTLTSGTVSGSDNIAVSGLLTWTNGSMLGTGITTANGGMEIRGGSNHFLGQGRQIDLPAGQTANWTSGHLVFTGEATFNNRGTFRAQHAGNRSIYKEGGNGTATFNSTFNNEGSFIKEIGTGITSIHGRLEFNNAGPGGVQVLTGTLRAQQGGSGQYMTGDADFTVAAGATLDFFVTPTWGNTVDITGMGTVLFNNGTYIINGTYDINGSTGHTRFLAGNVTFTPSSNLVSISGTRLLEVTNGKVDFSSGETTLENLTTYTLTNGTVSGSDNIAVSGLLTWTNGSMLGTGITTANGGMEIRGGSNHYLGQQLDLPSGQTANWTNGNIFFTGEATFNNRGTFRAQHTSNKGISRSGSGGAATFNNEESFIKEIGTGITSITPGIVFNNTGPGGVQVLTGTLRAQQGGSGQYMTGGADFTVAAGATLDFFVTPTWSNTVDITGMGTVLFNNGTYIIDGTYDINGSTGHTRFLAGNVTFTPSSNLVSISGTRLLEVTNGKVDFSSGETTLENLTTYTLTNGTVSGSDNIAVSGLLTWTNGSMLGTGITTANGGMEIKGGSNHYLGQQLDLPSGQTAIWTNGNIFFTGEATFNNRGTFRAQHESNKGINRSGSGGIATFNNEESFIKEIGTGTTTIADLIEFINTAGVQVLSGTVRYRGEDL